MGLGSHGEDLETPGHLGVGAFLHVLCETGLKLFEDGSHVHLGRVVLGVEVGEGLVKVVVLHLGPV